MPCEPWELLNLLLCLTWWSFTLHVQDLVLNSLHQQMHGIPCSLLDLFLRIISSLFASSSGWRRWTSFFVSSALWTIVLCFRFFSLYCNLYKTVEFLSSSWFFSPFLGSRSCAVCCPMFDKLFHIFFPVSFLMIEGKVSLTPP